MIQVSEVVGWFLDEINGGKAEFARAYRIAIRGWRELNWDVTGSLKTTSLEVDCDLTAKLPDDFLNHISIGVVNSNGKIATLTRNDRLTMECSDDEYFSSEEWYMNDSNLSILTASRSSLGIGSNNNIGEYRVDRGSNRIILNPDFCYRDVVLEYVSNGQEEGRECINELASEALLAYLRWKWHVAKKGVNRGDKLDYRSEYYNQKRLAKYRIRKPKLQEMNQASRENTKQGIKS